MDKSIIRIVNIVTAAIVIIGVILTLLVAAYGKDFSVNPNLKEKLLNPFFIVTYVVLVLAAVAALLFPFFLMLKTPKKLLGALALIAGIVILGLISYAISGNALSPERLQKLRTTAQISRTVGAGLIFTYFVAGFTILAFLFGSLSNFFKK